MVNSNRSLYLLYYTEACNEFYDIYLGVIASACYTAPFEEILQPWRAVGNTVSNLMGPRLEP